MVLGKDPQDNGETWSNCSLWGEVFIVGDLYPENRGGHVLLATTPRFTLDDAEQWNGQGDLMHSPFSREHLSLEIPSCR